MRTIYEQKNGNYSDLCHKLARDLIYPELFCVDKSLLIFESTTLALGEKQKILDGEMAVDRITRVVNNSLSAPIEFTIQERFRRPANLVYQDLTITEWNHASNLPSELYKLNAGIFLYAYANHDENPSGFLEWIAINTVDLLQAIAANKINYIKRRNKKQQDFIALRFIDLLKSNCVIKHGKRT